MSRLLYHLSYAARSRANITAVSAAVNLRSAAGTGKRDPKRRSGAAISLQGWATMADYASSVRSGGGDPFVDAAVDRACPGGKGRPVRLQQRPLSLEPAAAEPAL